METQEILDIAEACFGRAANPQADFMVYGFHVAPAIPDKKLVKACEEYARFDFMAESPVLLYDGTVFGSGKRGFLVTSRAIYFNVTSALDGISLTKGRMALIALRQFRLIGEALYLNHEKIGTIVAQPEVVVLALERFFHLVAGATSEEISIASTPAASTPDTIFEAIRQLKNLLDGGALTPEEFAAKKQELLARL